MRQPTNVISSDPDYTLGWKNGQPVLALPALPRDANGAILANVAHRTGTLASLLALGGSAGEISVATDQAASVLHTGTPGAARMLRAPQGTLMLAASHNPGSRNLVSGTLTTITGWTAPTHDPLGLLNTTTGVVNLSLLPTWSALTIRTSARFENRVNNGAGVRYLFASFTNGDVLLANVLPLVWSSPLSTVPLGSFHASTDERCLLAEPTPGAALSLKMYSTAGSSIEGWVTQFEIWMIPA